MHSLYRRCWLQQTCTRKSPPNPRNPCHPNKSHSFFFFKKKNDYKCILGGKKRHNAKHRDLAVDPTCVICSHERLHTEAETSEKREGMPMTAPAGGGSGSKQGGPRGRRTAGLPPAQPTLRRRGGQWPPRGPEAGCPGVRQAPPWGGWATLGGGNGLSALGEAVCACAGGAHPCWLWGLRSLEEKFLEAPGKPKGRRVVGEKKKKVHRAGPLHS